MKRFGIPPQMQDEGESEISQHCTTAARTDVLSRPVSLTRTKIYCRYTCMYLFSVIVRQVRANNDCKKNQVRARQPLNQLLRLV